MASLLDPETKKPRRTPKNSFRVLGVLRVLPRGFVASLARRLRAGLIAELALHLAKLIDHVGQLSLHLIEPSFDSLPGAVAGVVELLPGRSKFFAGAGEGLIIRP